jgi:hypothetical protein
MTAGTTYKFSSNTQEFNIDCLFFYPIDNISIILKCHQTAHLNPCLALMAYRVFLCVNSDTGPPFFASYKLEICPQDMNVPSDATSIMQFDKSI